MCAYVPGPLEAEVSSRLLSDQVTEVGVSPLSSVACMSASPSFCLSCFLLPLSLLVAEACSLRHPVLFLWQHYTPPLACLELLSFLPVFLSAISTLPTGGWEACDSPPWTRAHQPPTSLMVLVWTRAGTPEMLPLIITQNIQRLPTWFSELFLTCVLTRYPCPPQHHPIHMGGDGISSNILSNNLDIATSRSHFKNISVDLLKNPPW